MSDPLPIALSIPAEYSVEHVASFSSGTTVATSSSSTCTEPPPSVPLPSGYENSSTLTNVMGQQQQQQQHGQQAARTLTTNNNNTTPAAAFHLSSHSKPGTTASTSPDSSRNTTPGRLSVVSASSHCGTTSTCGAAAAPAGNAAPLPQPPRRRGRPKGSKNKRLSLSAALVPGHLSPARLRRASDNLCGPQQHHHYATTAATTTPHSGSLLHHGTETRRSMYDRATYGSSLFLGGTTTPTGYGGAFSPALLPPFPRSEAAWAAAAAATTVPGFQQPQQQQQQQHLISATSTATAASGGSAEGPCYMDLTQSPVGSSSSGGGTGCGRMNSGSDGPPSLLHSGESSSSSSSSSSCWERGYCSPPDGSPVTTPESPTLLMSRGSSSASGSPRGVLMSPASPVAFPAAAAALSPSTTSALDYASGFGSPAFMVHPTQFVPKISHFERCVLCGGTDLDHSTALVCSRRSCQRLFCLKCMSMSAAAPGISVFNKHVNECIVCVYQSRKRHLTDANQWHFDFRDESDVHFVRVLRDMLPMGNGLFIEISRTRQPCWRRKLRNGVRKHFSFRFYGGIFESRLEALEIGKPPSSVTSPEQHDEIHAIPSYPLASAEALGYTLADGVPFLESDDYKSTSLGLIGMGLPPPSSFGPTTTHHQEQQHFRQEHNHHQQQQQHSSPSSRATLTPSTPTGRPTSVHTRLSSSSYDDDDVMDEARNENDSSDCLSGHPGGNSQFTSTSSSQHHHHSSGMTTATSSSSRDDLMTPQQQHGAWTGTTGAMSRGMSCCTTDARSSSGSSSAETLGTNTMMMNAMMMMTTTTSATETGGGDGTQSTASQSARGSASSDSTTQSSPPPPPPGAAAQLSPPPTSRHSHVYSIGQQHQDGRCYSSSTGLDVFTTSKLTTDLYTPSERVYHRPPDLTALRSFLDTEPEIESPMGPFDDTVVPSWGVTTVKLEPASYLGQSTTSTVVTPTTSTEQHVERLRSNEDFTFWNPVNSATDVAMMSTAALLPDAVTTTPAMLGRQDHNGARRTFFGAELVGEPIELLPSSQGELGLSFPPSQLLFS